MSNPTASFYNAIPKPSDPIVERESYSRISYDSQKFFVYGENEYNPTYPEGNEEASDVGDHFFMSLPMGSTLLTKPDFVSEDAWLTVKLAPSVSTTANYSIMPKLMVPTSILISNGIDAPPPFFEGYAAKYKQAGFYKDLFNWTLISVDGEEVPASETYKHVGVGLAASNQYVTVGSKSDDRDTEVVLELNQPEDPPIGGWLAADSSDLVVGGAFSIMLRVTPTTEGTSTDSEESEEKWEINIVAGEIEMKLGPSGDLQVSLEDPAADRLWTTVNLSQGKTKDGNPQQKYMEGDPYIIVVRPVWNGIIVSNGVQEARKDPQDNTPVNASSTFIPKLKGASVMLEPWSSGFDPLEPDEVLVGQGSGDSDVSVDFGTKVIMTSKNCRYKMAYLPCFFSSKAGFDEWMMTTDEVPGVLDFEYEIYPIWTKNGTSMTLGSLDLVNTGQAGPLTNTTFQVVKWRMDQLEHTRVSGELFGAIINVKEQRKSPVRNDNGNFDIAWTGSGGGWSDSSSWEDAVQSVSCSIGLDGSSGTMVVDKMAVAGQDAKAVQSVGALVVYASGGFETQAGYIFQGLGMGIGDSISSQGGTWNVPLVGLEKKMEDIALINVPFMDGKPLLEVVKFLCDYAGLFFDSSRADINVRLSSSESIDISRFDWKSSTSVKSALDEVMEDTNHTYVVEDGVVKFFELDTTSGWPVDLGPDWASSYPNTKAIIKDLTPDFEDVRNEIVILAMERVEKGQGAKIEDPPIALRVSTVLSNTVPEIPWAKSMVEGLPGFHTLEVIEDFADRRRVQTNNYETIGRVTIAGNSEIKLYDMWDDYVIYSVNHNLDLASKTWTTDLEFGG